MFGRFDDFAIRYLGIVRNGASLVIAFLENILAVLENIFWAMMALVMIVVTFPLWLLGKSAQQNVESDESYAKDGVSVSE